jgi:SAM-dependent methyltransferase
MRFAFGQNWRSYSQTALTQDRIAQARNAFHELLDGIDLRDKKFIDIGFGQGLSLILALEMGANASGIDIDNDNVGALKITQQAMEYTQTIEARVASILDAFFVQNHKRSFDIVHSWGVLHHTGDMTRAIENACTLVGDRGYFVCSIYNRHWSSPFWRAIKWFYNKLPTFAQSLIVGLFYPFIWAAKWIVTRENPKKKERGMDFFHDVVDWVGGYPYEYASEKEIRSLVSDKGFECLRVRSAQVPTGCNEFIFQKKDSLSQGAPIDKQ